MNIFTHVKIVFIQCEVKMTALIVAVVLVYDLQSATFNKIVISNNKFQMAKWTRKPLAYRESINFLIYV